MRARAQGLAAIAAAAAALLPACLEVPDKDPPMCKVTADCDEGELCDEGVCWGNPPMGAFAAVVSPPSARGADLVSREVPVLPISPDGWIEDIHLDDAVTFKGRLQAQCEGPLPCSGRKLGASITISRPSVFAGGPGFRKLVTVDANAETFELVVPATRPGDPPYAVTAVPDDRASPGTGTSLAQFVPPLFVRIDATSSGGSNLLTLGGAGLRTVTGAIVTSGGNPVGGYRVVALGRWEADQPLSEVSTVDFTGANGAYVLALSRNLVGTVEIVARPFDAQLRPELHLTGVPVNQDSTDKVLELPGPTVGNVRLVEVIVDHQDTGGEIARVAGATVTIASAVSTNSNATAQFVASATTDESGAAYLELLDTPSLANNYQLSINPQPGSKAAAVFGKRYSIQTSMAQRLGTRIAITGRVLDATGEPVQDVSVTARPSLRFLWSLEPGPQTFLGGVPAATTVTPENGEFVLFVDHAFENGAGAQASTVWGHYDLSFEPTKKARVPSFTHTDVELPRDDAQSALAIGPIQLPDAAYVRGNVYDDENARVEGAEVKLYRVRAGDALCAETRFEPTSCPIPPLLLGRGTTDQGGVVRLTLPR